MNVLLVDDEPGIREGLAALLRKQGHDVRTAADCASAGALLAQDFDVVVTDWRLPDGTAASFLAAARCPAITVSGHPEEVEAEHLPAVRAVMTKPVTPRTLLAALAAMAAPRRAAASPLPVDVQAAIDGFVAALPAAAAVECHDDGTFVAIEAVLPAGAVAPAAPRDGELARASRDGRCVLRWRLRRDGHTAQRLPVLAPDAAWPVAGAFAVDFHDSALAPAAFAACLDRVGAARAAGARVQFWNVPPNLRAFATSHGRAHDMPMRDPVGPVLPTEQADLWRDP